MRHPYIYLVTNTIDGRRYVGQHDGSKPHYFGSGSYLNRAVMKYGKQAFKREILCSGPFCSELLDFLECEAIDKYKTYIHDYPDSGYNLTLGGLTVSGMKHTPEAIRKTCLNNPRRKPVYQFTKEGILLSFYSSSFKAGRDLGISSSSIYRAASGNTSTAAGFLWSFKNKVKPLIERPNVYCYSLDGKFIRAYLTMVDAANQLGTTHTAISNAVKSKGESYGFQWRTEMYTSLPEFTKKKEAIATTAIKARKAVNMLTMGSQFVRSFASIKQAAESIGLSTSGFKSFMNGKQTHWGGYKWEYAEGFSQRKNKKTRFVP